MRAKCADCEKVRNLNRYQLCRDCATAFGDCYTDLEFEAVAVDVVSHKFSDMPELDISGLYRQSKEGLHNESE